MFRPSREVALPAQAAPQVAVLRMEAQGLHGLHRIKPLIEWLGRSESHREKEGKQNKAKLKMVSCLLLASLQASLKSASAPRFPPSNACDAPNRSTVKIPKPIAWLYDPGDLP